MAVLQKIDNPYGMIQTVEHCESFSIYRSQDSTGDCEVTVYPVFSRIIEYGFSEQNFISSSSGLTKTSSRIHEKHLGTRFISIATDTPW